MTELSWLLYLADVAGSAGGWLTVIGFIGAICLVIALIVSWASFDTTYEDYRTSMRRFSGKAFVAGTIFAFIGVFGSIAMPSKDTVYAIAAAEVGEEILSSPTVAKATRALEAWLDRQIQPPANNP